MAEQYVSKINGRLVKDTEARKSIDTLTNLQRQTEEQVQTNYSEISQLKKDEEAYEKIVDEHEERIREFELEGIKVIETASSMDDVLSQDPNSALHYYYMYIGETTEKYTQGAVYKVKAV